MLRERRRDAKRACRVVLLINPRALSFSRFLLGGGEGRERVGLVVQEVDKSLPTG